MLYFDLGELLEEEEPRRRFYGIPSPDPGEELPLLCACKAGDLIEVKRLVEENPSRLQEMDAEKMSPLFVALIFGHADVARWFIEHHLDVSHRDIHKNTAIHYTVYLRSMELTQLLIERCPDVITIADTGTHRNRCFHLAVMTGSVEMVEFLLKQPGVVLNSPVQYGPNPLWSAALLDRVDIFKWLFERDTSLKDAIDDDGFGIFHHSAWNGALKVVRWLLSQGLGDVRTSPSPSWPNVLSMATQTGSYELLKWILANYDDMIHPNSEGVTPLLMAASQGRLACLKLLEQHEDVTRTNNDGSNAMMYACGGGHLAVVQYLATKGLSIETCDTNHWKPIHRAAGNGRLDVVEWLLDQGVPIESLDRMAYTPLHVACDHGRLEVAKALVARGANLHARTIAQSADHAAIGTPFLVAANGKQLGIMKWLYSLAPGEVETARTDLKKSAYDVCARSGLLDGLVWLEDIGLPFDPKELEASVSVIAEFGELDVLKWLHERAVNMDVNSTNGCSPTLGAILGGKLDTLKWLCSIGSQVRPLVRGSSSVSPIIFAVRANHITVLEYLTEEHHFNLREIDHADPLAYEALKNASSIPTLSYLFYHDVPLVSRVKPNGSLPTYNALHKACSSGFLNIVKWLHRHGVAFDAPGWRSNLAMEIACASGKLDIVKYFLNHGYSQGVTDGIALQAARKSGNQDLIAFIQTFNIVPPEQQ